jgi:hypothetical protein
LDLFIANSHPDDSIDKIKSDVTYSEPLLLFHNTGKGLEDVSLQSGPIFTKNFSARGLAPSLLVSTCPWRHTWWCSTWRQSFHLAFAGGSRRRTHKKS